MSLAGRRVLITGASSGIGAATARAVAQAGGAVALVARRTERITALAEDLGGVAVPGDVTDTPAVADMVARAVDGLGGLDALVNSAGITRPGLIADADPADWRAMFDVNVLGLLAVTQAAVPHLRRSENGSIVNVSSMSGRRVPSPTGGVYAATKFAVHALSESLRQELQSDGIRVTTIAPGFVDTGLFDALEDNETTARYRRLSAEKGLGPADVARAIVHVLAAPPSVAPVEVALVATAQT